MRRLLTVMVAALLGLGWPGLAAAQNYPTRAITMIVPFPAGGATDTLARFLAEKMRAILGQPLLIVGKKSLPADDLKGLIAWLKANPDKASVGIAGVGAAGHLTGISFQKETGTKFQFIPYRGNGPAMQDLLAEQIDFMIEPASNFKALLAAGSVKPFALTGKARLAC